MAALRWLLGIGLGVAICIIGNGLVDLILGSGLLADGAWGFIDADDVLAIHIALSTIPLLPAALSRRATPAAWLLAIGFSLGNYVFGAFYVLLTRCNVIGADIGFGILMMILPFIEALGVAAFILRRRKGRQRGQLLG